MVPCKTFETVTGESGFGFCSFFMFCQVEEFMLGTLYYVIYMYRRIYVTKCK